MTGMHDGRYIPVTAAFLSESFRRFRSDLDGRRGTFTIDTGARDNRVLSYFVFSCIAKRNRGFDGEPSTRDSSVDLLFAGMIGNSPGQGVGISCRFSSFDRSPAGTCVGDVTWEEPIISRGGEEGRRDKYCMGDATCNMCGRRDMGGAYY